jgi:hypothetical protein
MAEHSEAAGATHDLPATSIRGKIEQVMNADSQIRWTTQKMLAHLQTTGFPLKAQKPIYTIGQSLQKLADKNRIVLLKRGAGGSPNIYRGKTIAEQNASLQHPGGATEESDSK